MEHPLDSRLVGTRLHHGAALLSWNIIMTTHMEEAVRSGIAISLAAMQPRLHRLWQSVP